MAKDISSTLLKDTPTEDGDSILPKNSVTSS